MISLTKINTQVITPLKWVRRTQIKQRKLRFKVNLGQNHRLLWSVLHELIQDTEIYWMLMFYFRDKKLEIPQKIQATGRVSNHHPSCTCTSVYIHR